jgi:hypothetical protein
MRGGQTVCGCLLTGAVACVGAGAANPSDGGVPNEDPQEGSVEQDAECFFSTTVGNARFHLHLTHGSPLVQGLDFRITGRSPPMPIVYSVSIEDASDVFEAGGLPAGGPDTIAVLDDAAVPPGETCAGSATFTIVACTTIDVPLDVTCTEPPEAGGDDAD